MVVNLGARPGAKSSVLDQLLSELNTRTKAGTASGTPSLPYLHGPNGLWSYPGLERPVISTRVHPMGISSVIPARENNSMNPMYPYFTGFTDPSESQPNGVCDDPPTAGQTKNCLQTAVFGRYSYQTREVDITRLGQIINRGEFTDLVLVNNPIGIEPTGLGGGNNGLTYPGGVADGGQALIINEMSTRFMELGVKFQNKLMRQFWYGNPVNNTGGGGYKEFAGLDYLIRTGIRDAVTGQTCPSLDSLIVNANYKKVTDSSGNDNMVNVLTYTMRMLINLAKRSGLDPVRWVVAMRETLFYELSAIWPCNYLTYRCTVMGTSQEVIVDAGDAIALRDSMRAEQFLIMDGRRIDVVFDDAIDEETSGDTNRITNGCFASDIYFLPLTFQGNNAALFWEYFNWNGVNAALNAATVAASPLLANYYWSDGGKFIWHMKTPVNWCLQYEALIEPRVVLRTPHLAAKIQNVQYCPLMHPRDAFPDDPYFVNGGVTSRTTAPSLYNSWSS